jgi:autotransporter-associated beta strand protein
VLEILEDRLAPAATITSTAAAITILVPAAETATVNVAGGRYVITDAAGISGASSGGVTAGNTFTATAAAAGQTSFTIGAGSGGTVQLLSANVIPTTTTVAVNAGTLDLSGNADAIDALTGSGVVTNSGAAATLTIGSNNGTGSFSGTIAGGAAMSVTKVGTGTETYAGTNTYTGLTQVNNGTLLLNATGPSSNAKQTITVTGAGGQPFDVSLYGVSSFTVDPTSTIIAFEIQFAANAANIPYNIAQAGNVYTVSFTGPGFVPPFAIGGPYPGSATVATVSPGSNPVAIAGNLVIGDNSANNATVRCLGSNQLANSSTVTVNSDGNFDLNGKSQIIDALIGTGTVTNSSASSDTFTIGAGNGSGTFGGVISDANNSRLVKNGTGTETLAGANTYNGVTEVAAGALRVANSSALSGSSTIVDTGGRLELQSSVSNSETLILNDAIPAGAPTYTITAPLTNVSGNNTYNGPIVLNTPYVAIGAAAGSTLTLSNVISEASPNTTLALTQPGTVVLQGANTWTGTTEVDQGALCIENSNALSNSSGIDVFDGAQLQVQNDRFGNPVTVVANQLNLTGTGIGSTGALLDTGSLGSTNTVNGPLTLTGDTTIGVANAGDTLNLTGNITQVTNAVQKIVLGGTVTGGSFTLTFNSSTTGNIPYNAAALIGYNIVPGVAQALNSIGANVTAQGNPGGPYFVTFNSAGSQPPITATSSLTGTSPTITITTTAVGGANRGLTKVGPGTLVLGGTNTYTAPTTINAGSLEVNGNTSGSSFIVNGGTLGGSGTVQNFVNGGGGGSVNPGLGLGTATLNSSATAADNLGGLTFVADVSGVSSDDLVKAGSSLSLTNGILAVNTLAPPSAGPYTIINSPGGFGGTSFANIPVNNVVLADQAGTQFYRVNYVGGTQVQLTPVAPLTTLHWIGAQSSSWSDPRNWLEMTAPISGDTLVFDTTTAGFATFAPNNDITGLTGLTLVINDASAAGNFDLTGSSVSLAAGGITSSVSNGVNATVAMNLTLPAAATSLTVNAGSPLVLSGTVTGSGALNSSGAGTLVLSGGSINTTGFAQNYNNNVSLGTPFTILAGIVNFNAGLNLGTNVVQVAGTLNFTNTATLTTTFAGPTPSQVGHMLVGGGNTTYGNATLVLNYVGFTPMAGQSFDIVSNGGFGIGQFVNAPAPGPDLINGIYYLVTYSGTAGSGDFILTVGQQPVITSASSATFTVSSAGSFTVTTTGNPPPTITVAGGLPAGVTLVNNGNGTATIAGTPAPDTGGIYVVTLTAANGVLPNAVQTFTLSVEQAPAITSAGNATFPLGSAGSFTITTSGFPAATIKVTGSLPSGLTFTDNGNGTATVAGTPSGVAPGMYSVAITVSNGVGPAVTQAFVITIVPSTTHYIVTGAGAGGGPQVNVYNAGTGALVASFFAFAPSFTGGVRVAVADVNSDGTPDIICAAGPGGGPQVIVIDGTKLNQLQANGQIANAAIISSFYAFTPTFAGGVYVGAAVSVSGQREIVVGAGAGGGPQVEVIDASKIAVQSNGQIANSALLTSFFAFSPTFAGGVRVALGDINGDGTLDIIAGAGPGGGPQVVVIDGTKLRQVQSNGQIANTAVLTSFFAFNSALSGGVFVAAGDVDGSGKVEIIVSAGPASLMTLPLVTVPAADGLRVAVFDSTGTQHGTFMPYPASFLGGASVGTVSIKGKVDILTGAGPTGGPETEVFDGSSFALLDSFFAFPQSFTGGVFVAGG